MGIVNTSTPSIIHILLCVITCKIYYHIDFQLCNAINYNHPAIHSVQFSSVTQSCLTLCDPMGWSSPGLPIHHQLLEFTQTHVHRVSDAIQPSHPLSSPSPPAFNLSHHQSLFQWVSSSHEVAKYWSFSFNFSLSNEHPGLIFFRMDSLISLQSKGL